MGTTFIQHHMILIIFNFFEHALQLWNLCYDLVRQEKVSTSDIPHLADALSDLKLLRKRVF